MPSGILVLAEQLKGTLSEITLEMLGLGRTLARELKVPLTAVLVGDQVAGLAGKLGAADRVLVVEGPALAMPPAASLATVLQAALDKTQAALVLVGGTNLSMGIGTVLALRTKLPFVNFCKALRVQDGALLATSQLFGGKILSDVQLPGGQGIVSIYPGTFPAEAGKSEQTPAIESLQVALPAPAINFKKFIEPETGDVDITKQDILVAVGRGIQSQDNLTLAEDLATALGGAVCASRPVIDQGWMSLSRQVGKSGMSVKPRLYLALGISGAPEHWEGMQGSRLIVAFNTDPKAPIFDGAHFGAVADILDVLPVLTDKVKAKKG